MPRSKKILFILLMSSMYLHGQDKYTLFFYPYSKQMTCDSLEVSNAVSNYLIDLYAKGHLLASVDSITFVSKEIHVYVTHGDVFKWGKLREGNLTPYLKSRSGYKDRFYSEKPFRYKEVADLMKRIIIVSESIGYPFAQVKLDSIHIEGKRFSASLNYISGPLIKFDSIEVHGSARVKKKFLQRYLGIQPGSPFDQSKVDNVSSELAKLSYIEQERPYMLLFGDNKAKLVLFLKDRKVNHFDGIVGVLPNEGSDRKVLVTGQLSLALQNFFGSGKKLDVEWQRYNKESQLLDLSYAHPVFLGSSLDLDAFFKLLKQDSSFMNVDRGIGLYHNLRKYGRIGFYVNVKSSRMISAEDADNRDFNVYQYGVSYQYQNLDHISFPRKGWHIAGAVAAGNKTMRGVRDDESEIPKKTLQMYGDLSLSKFTKVSRQTTLLAAFKNSAVINNQQVYYVADFYRIGGLKSLRGFNENNFYAQYYAMATLEYRIFLEESTYLLTFVDQALIVNPLLKQQERDWPTGIGVGLSFNSGPGVFTFIYSLGRNSEQSFNFNLSKIHFGFISRF